MEAIYWHLSLAAGIGVNRDITPLPVLMGQDMSGILSLKLLWFPSLFPSHFQSIGPLGRCFLYVDLSICVSVCLSDRLFTFEVPFKRLFAPTSQNQMSKILRDSESLGGRNEKKWFELWKLLLIKGVKTQNKKKFVFGQISQSPEVKCPSLLDFWNPWGKVMERSGFRFVSA